MLYIVYGSGLTARSTTTLSKPIVTNKVHITILHTHCTCLLCCYLCNVMTDGGIRLPPSCCRLHEMNSSMPVPPSTSCSDVPYCCCRGRETEASSIEGSADVCGVKELGSSSGPTFSLTADSIGTCISSLSGSLSMQEAAPLLMRLNRSSFLYFSLNMPLFSFRELTSSFCFLTACSKSFNSGLRAGLFLLYSLAQTCFFFLNSAIKINNFSSSFSIRFSFPTILCLKADRDSSLLGPGPVSSKG
ncbi:hypothetical protein AB205_0220580, partial [Aquarana catesbeiana]